MNNTNFTESIGVINPKTKRYQAYDIIKGRIVPYKDPYMYSKAAKRLCTQYINIFGYEPEMVVPPDLKIILPRFWLVSLIQTPKRETHMARSKRKNIF